MTKKTFMGIGLALVLTAAPLLVSATTVTGASSGSGGFLGVSNNNSSFTFSWGTGATLCTSSICGVAATIIAIINNILVPLLFAVAFITFLYGVAKKYIFSHGDGAAVSEGHKLILWGLIGFVVMISLWGLVNVVATTFGLTGVGAPAYPSSVPTGI